MSIRSTIGENCRIKFKLARSIFDRIPRLGKCAGLTSTSPTIGGIRRAKFNFARDNIGNHNPSLRVTDRVVSSSRRNRVRCCYCRQNFPSNKRTDMPFTLALAFCTQFRIFKRQFGLRLTQRCFGSAPSKLTSIVSRSTVRLLTAFLLNPFYQALV